MANTKQKLKALKKNHTLKKKGRRIAVAKSKSSKPPVAKTVTKNRARGKTVGRVAVVTGVIAAIGIGSGIAMHTNVYSQTREELEVYAQQLESKASEYKTVRYDEISGEMRSLESSAGLLLSWSSYSDTIERAKELIADYERSLIDEVEVLQQRLDKTIINVEGYEKIAIDNDLDVAELADIKSRLIELRDNGDIKRVSESIALLTSKTELITKSVEDLKQVKDIYEEVRLEFDQIFTPTFEFYSANLLLEEVRILNDANLEFEISSNYEDYVSSDLEEYKKNLEDQIEKIKDLQSQIESKQAEIDKEKEEAIEQERQEAEAIAAANQEQSNSSNASDTVEQEQATQESTQPGPDEIARLAAEREEAERVAAQQAEEERIRQEQIAASQQANIDSNPWNGYGAAQYLALFDNRSFPGSSVSVPAPYINGDEEMDAYIRTKAEARGYRLRPVVSEGLLIWVDGQRLHPSAASAWNNIKSSAANDGIVLTMVSGYRSVDDQRGLFNASFYTTDKAGLLAGSYDQWLNSTLSLIAPPGYSKHHTGYTFDVGTNTYGVFGSTPAFDWMSRNSYANSASQSIVPTYPAGGVNMGPNPEPWEYAYVGS